MSTATELADFANGLSSGHLKNWKANSIVGTLEQIPEISQDYERLNSYLTNCLEMEGFNVYDIKIITTYIKEMQ